MLVAAAAGPPRFSLVMPLMAEVSQSRQTFICLKDHVTTVATVTTIRATTRHKLLAAEACSTITTSTGTNVNVGKIDHVLREIISCYPSGDEQLVDSSAGDLGDKEARRL
jgi:hypothetical protein